MKEKQIKKQMIKFCEAREKETPDLKNGYYTKIKNKLKSKALSDKFKI